MKLRWGQSTDIWSFGTTVSDPHRRERLGSLIRIALTLPQLISLIWGLDWHIFKPDPQDATADAEDYTTHILMQQIIYFGPVPLSFVDLMARADDRWEILGSLTQHILDNRKQKPFVIAQDDCLTEEDRRFLLTIMKFDPRERPTARQLLQDEWFSGVL